MDLEMYKFMYNFYKENKTIVLVSIITAIVRAGLDSIIVPRALAEVFNSLSSSTEKKFAELRQSIIVLVITWIILKITYITSTYYRKLIEPRITEYIINKIVYAVFQKFEKINELSNVSVVINKIHIIKKNLQELFYLIFTIFIPKIIVLFLSLINLISLNRQIGLFIVAALALQATVINYTYSNCIHKSFDEIKEQDKMYEYMEDVFNNINLVQSTYKGYDIEIDEICQLTNNVSSKEDLSISCINTQQNQSFLINIIIFITILCILYNLYSTQQISNKEVVTIILSINGMFENIYDFAIYIPEFISRIGVLESNEEFLKDLMQYYSEDNKNEVIELKENFIIFENVTFNFKSHAILNSFSIILPSNKIIGLTGPSGSGKSTFIKLIFGIETPSDGEIYIGNIPIIKKNCKSLRQYINYMNQNSHSLFDKTVFENIVYGYKDTTREQIISLIEKFNLYDVFKIMDTGKEKYSFFDKNTGKLGSNLSGGQKAIIHLIRLDLNQVSKIIILDEVTASLDNVSRNSIIEYIKYLNKKNKTVVIISHDTYLESIYDIQLQFSYNKNPILVK